MALKEIAEKIREKTESCGDLNGFRNGKVGNVIRCLTTATAQVEDTWFIEPVRTTVTTTLTSDEEAVLHKETAYLRGFCDTCRNKMCSVGGATPKCCSIYETLAILGNPEI